MPLKALSILLPSPVQDIQLPLLQNKNIRLMIKRDDLIHPWVSGNKYRKLKYNLQEAIKTQKDTIITFGGAFSNHLHATAGACQLLGLKSVGIIRGETDLSNPTLLFCKKMGMELIGVSRSQYRLKDKDAGIQQIIQNYPNSYLVPEGGTNSLAMSGTAEIVSELRSQLKNPPDYIVLSCGTGGTVAGILRSSSLESRVVAFSALKSEHLRQEVNHLSGAMNTEKFTLQTDCHFGGYARWDKSLIDFITSFEKDTGVPLDHVYTGKAMYGLFKLISTDYFPSGSEICFIHTGGLQGRDGLDYLQKKGITGASNTL